MKLQRAKIAVAFLTVAGWLFIAAVAFFLTFPTLRDIRSLSDEILKAHAELAAQYANRKNLLSNSVKVVEGRETLKSLSAMFIPAGEELSFITAVEEIAERNGVGQRIQIVPGAGPLGGIEELRTGFEISLSGPYRQVLQALVEVERLPSLVVVETFSVRPGGTPAPGSPAQALISIRGAVAQPPKGL